MLPDDLTEEEQAELVSAVFQYTSETEYRTEIIRTLAFYGIIFIIFVLLAIWIL